jgi:mono/diheme cytochrome c family protein
VGASQREATVVAIGLVIVATLAVVYLFNEPNRRDTAAADKIEESAHRGIELYAQYCVQCHGEDGLATGRIGVPLNTEQNQTEDPLQWEQREPIIRRTIERGRGAVMPAWHQSEQGPLNDEQVTDLVNLIHEGLWDEVTATVLEQNNGQIPTPPPPPTPPPAGPEQGQQLFGQVCATCHIADDFPQGGAVGPDLTGLGAKEQTDVVGIPVTQEDLVAWVNDPQAIKPGSPMPAKGGATNWGDTEVQSVVEYLLSLTGE